jgi:hypothetical protein
MLRAALESGEARFARQAALAWLAAFPGDLEVSLLQAEALLLDGRAAAAEPVIQAGWQKDPFAAQAYRLLVRAARQDTCFAETSLFVVEGVCESSERLEAWGEPLRMAWQALLDGKPSDAEGYVENALRARPDLLLAEVIRLLVVRSVADTQAVFQLAQMLNARWPECLPVRLVMAEAQMALGNAPEAVRMLHLCASGDAAGQTARRLWGDSNPYQALWPDDMVILLDMPVPAAVAGRMGWNRLLPGENLAQLDPPVNEASQAKVAAEEKPEGAYTASAAEIAFLEALLEKAEAVGRSEEPGSVAAQAPGLECDDGLQVAEELPTGPRAAQSQEQAAPARSRRRTDVHGATPAVAGELERLAKKLKQPGPARMDSRHPVYVIFSSREGLERQYGAQTSAVIHTELRKLADEVQKRPGWSARVYYPDDAACTASVGLTPVNPRDPWKLKNALCDLDLALRNQGEMIGALLIIGSDGVVPFHRLPNPTDDGDGEIPSDSPYATLDANYFVPEWPVGRLPGEYGPDASMLLEQLRLMQRSHGRIRRARTALALEWLSMLGAWMGRVLPARRPASFGYTAAVWRRSSLAVFRPIGAPHTVKASPPEHSGSLDRKAVASSSLGYYNLHGTEDGPEWYGQRDPLDRGDCPDYPIALSPADLHRNGRAPRVVFSEACYGAFILGKTEKDSLALKFLCLGTQAVIGSTSTAYGSMNTPLIAADLLGHRFWQHLKTGRPVGEALVQAKLDLVREMKRRQGYLDGEDQKTLISFVLYGDPLASYDGFRANGKFHRLTTHAAVKTIPDQVDAQIPAGQVPAEVVAQVKNLAAEYLPGADLSKMRFTRLETPVEYAVQSKPREKKGPSAAGRMVVTVSKQIQTAERTHRQIMRVTVDATGKALKLSISR